MHNFTRSALISSVFNFVCVTVTLTMVGYWCYEYFKDNDLSLVDYTKFGNVQDAYPVMSMCFDSPFVDEKLKQIHPDLNRSHYLKFLKGEIYDAELRNIDYDNVTLNILDYIGDYIVHWRNGSKIVYNMSNSVLRKPPRVIYSGFLNGYITKCFTIEIRNKHMQQVKGVYYSYKQQIFGIYPNGSRPTDGSFGTIFHIPSQFLLSMQTARYGWPERNGKSGYYMSFTINVMEVLRRRNKRKDPCTSNWRGFDQFVMDHILAKVGCRAPYQTQYRTDLPICTGREKMKESLFAFDAARSFTAEFTQPCVAMTNIQDHYTEVDTLLIGKGEWFGTLIIFPDHLRYIRQSKEITFHTLVGNAGGYIGLFLGEY